MAKLPGLADLGGLPRPDQARSIGVVDVSPFARGGAALAAGTEALGKGVSKAGEGIADVGLDENRWEYAKASADFVTRKVDLDAETSKDTNYGPDESGKSLPERYKQNIDTLHEQSAALITDPRMRERFIFETKPDIERGVVGATNHAKGLENDANIAYVQQQGDNLMNQAINAPDDSTRTRLIDTHNQLVDGLVAKGAITQQNAFAMKQAWAHQFATADLLSRAETDPEGVINELRAKPGSPAAITNRILGVEGTARNPSSSAVGAGQFISSTWLDIIKRNRPDLAQGRSDAEILALRADSKLGRQMTEAYRSENEAFLKSKGIEPTPGAQYLAHFLGPGGAAAVLQADPKKPVADVLAAAVGPAKAKQMIDANPSILNGQLAGSVKAWADNKMGGVTPGGGSIYDNLRPDVREQILTRAQTQLQKQTVDGISDFKIRVQDTTAEAMRTGQATNPLSREEFIAQAGAELGPKAYDNYTADLQLGQDMQSVSRLDIEEQRALLTKYEPQPGAEGYAAQVKRRETLAKAMQQIQTERNEDPAGFAVSRLAASREAYRQFGAVLGDPTADPAARQAAARSFADKTLLEQSRIGIPTDDQRILPAGYVEHLTTAITSAADSEDPQKRVGLIPLIQREAAMWGDNWPSVMRQMGEKTAPIVRAISAGADPVAMTRLLSLGKDEAPAKLLKEQNESKFRDLTKSLNDEMAPFLRSLVGRQKDRDFTGYYNLGEKLAALYVRDGDKPEEAAHKAFGALVGNRYDFRDTYRIPKSSGVSADDVQAGVQTARGELASGVQIKSSADDANADMKLTPQEQALYARHSKNLTGTGGVDNSDGSRSTLKMSTFEIDGKTYAIPTVWDGKILPADEALKRAKAEGLNKFPSYASEAEAEARYDKMHSYMEQDTGRFLQARNANPLHDIRPAINDIGIDDARGDSMSKFARDGTWVTSYDNGGLNLVYGDKFVRRNDGKPLFLSWADLAARGKSTRTAGADYYQPVGVQ